MIKLKPRLALDLDSTLAATAEVAFDLMLDKPHNYSYEDIESWTWGFEEFGKWRFLSGMWHAWTLRRLDVPFMEPRIPEKVERLTNHFEVDIVTDHPGHPGITEGKREWLNHHDIPYNELVVVNGKCKSSLGYDAYVDDKPHLPININRKKPEADIYLRDHSYNKNVEGNYVRIESLEEVLNHV